MAIKKINQNPTIIDTILLEIETPDIDGCFLDNPYKVDHVTIYYIERNFLGNNYGEYDKINFSAEQLIELEKARKAFCEDPTESNCLKYEAVVQKNDSSKKIDKFYYKERTAVKVIGTEGFPAWIGTDIENSPLTLVSEDENGDVQYGKFTYEWNPNGQIREGDYFICWTWTPLPAGEKLSAHQHFIVEGDSSAVTTIPSHITPPEKYNTLLELYLPEMYKCNMISNDKTPEVTQKLNESVAKGFTYLEDLVNQMIDLFDANALHESMLKYLSNLFALKLKSNDPTLWRRQIKEAIPLFKKKGTLEGLKQAFSQSGMSLEGITQYWQIKSKYTHIESFEAVDSLDFKLEKNVILPIDEENFQLWFKPADENEFGEISSDYVEFSSNDEGDFFLVWKGGNLSVNPMNLYKGDQIKVMYQFKEIPNSQEQSYENYIRSLPLMDQRDENEQKYPPKNWNIKLIDEKDPLFDVLIPVRHPFADPVQFGMIRTEFAYSENIYNMEEYNGSTRPSFNACHIDKSFLDPCEACLSSSYSVDISIDELCNDRIVEAQDVLKEYMPFHAQLHTVNFSGGFSEFVESPTESIEQLITYDYLQNVISGESNPFFNRTMHDGLGDSKVTRDDLTEETIVVSDSGGLAFNSEVIFISPDHSLRSAGIDASKHILEVLSPSANSGTYKIGNIEGNIAKVITSINEPLNQSGFTFNLSNISLTSNNAKIDQHNLISLEDDGNDLSIFPYKTLWDVEKNNYVGELWKILIPSISSVPFEIKDVEGSKVIIKYDSLLPTTNLNGISYKIINSTEDVVLESNNGKIKVRNQGLVTWNTLEEIDYGEFISVGDRIYYDSQEYEIIDISDDRLLIDLYNSGNVSGVSVQTRRRLISNGIGYFCYRGLNLTTANDYEDQFEIINGHSSPLDGSKDENNFKENFVFKIDGNYYKISRIEGNEVVLDGRLQEWTTLNHGGTSVNYSLIHLEKKQVNIGMNVFDELDHSGKDPVERRIYDLNDQNTAVTMLSQNNNGGFQDNLTQTEGIGIIIETKNGERFEGELC